MGVEEPGDIGTLEVAMRDINVLPQYVSRTTGCYLLPNGDLSFILPAECEQTEPLGLQLRSPDGTVIWSLSSSRQSLAGSNFWNWVANPLIYSPLSFNAAAQGEMLRFRGKVVDLQGCRQVSHRQVIIWGQRDQQNILQPVG